MIELTSISKSFKVEGKDKLVLDGIDFTVAKGEFVSIMGPSGCGKSTLLNVIAGLEQQDKGTITLAGISIDQRLGKIGYMQQKDLLLPWRTVLDNAILGLEVQGISKNSARTQALALTETFGLKGFENQYPFTLSGGMRQRAAFLRTMLVAQDIMLLDEPFGSLDSMTRVQMQEWLLNLWEKVKKTIVLVTHDVDEAILLSDRICILSPRPARVAQTLNVELARPRDYTAVTNPSFVKMKSYIHSLLLHKVNSQSL